MELLIDRHQIAGSNFYRVRCWYDPSEDRYYVRYSWYDGRRQYTRGHYTDKPRSALYLVSYFTHRCRQHIGLESWALLPPTARLTPASRLHAYTPTEGRNYAACSLQQPSAQRKLIMKKYDENRFFKTIISDRI